MSLENAIKVAGLFISVARLVWDIVKTFVLKKRESRQTEQDSSDGNN